MFRFLLLTLACAGIGSPGLAIDIDYGRVTFLPGWSETDGTMFAAIQIELNPGWKTYWRVPGAVGIPPNFNWIGSRNLSRAEVVYPAPQVEIVGGLQSIGYHNQVVFPIKINPLEIGQPVDIALDFTFGVCAEICIPAEQKFALTLDPNSAAQNRSLIDSALNQGPSNAKSAGVLAANCSISPNGRDFLLLANIRLQRALQNIPAVIFELGSPDLWADSATTRIEGNMVFAQAPLQYYGKGGLVLERSKIRLTLIGNGYAVDIQGCPA